MSTTFGGDAKYFAGIFIYYFFNSSKLKEHQHTVFWSKSFLPADLIMDGYRMMDVSTGRSI